MTAKEGDPIRNDARRQQRAERLGPKPVCVLCGESRPDTLMKVTRKFLEDHHVAIRVNDTRLTVPLCRNCHADLTEQQRSAGCSFQPAGTVLHRVISCLRGVALFLPNLAAACRRWADQLERFVQMLDREFPDWRNRPEAK